MKSYIEDIEWAEKAVAATAANEQEVEDKFLRSRAPMSELTEARNLRQRATLRLRKLRGAA